MRLKGVVGKFSAMMMVWTHHCNYDTLQPNKEDNQEVL